jgi:hypothetical protein
MEALCWHHLQTMTCCPALIHGSNTNKQVVGRWLYPTASNRQGSRGQNNNQAHLFPG